MMLMSSPGLITGMPPLFNFGAAVPAGKSGSAGAVWRRAGRGGRDETRGVPSRPNRRRC